MCSRFRATSSARASAMVKQVSQATRQPKIQLRRPASCSSVSFTRLSLMSAGVPYPRCSATFRRNAEPAMRRLWPRWLPQTRARSESALPTYVRLPRRYQALDARIARHRGTSQIGGAVAGSRVHVLPRRLCYVPHAPLQLRSRRRRSLPTCPTAKADPPTPTASQWHVATRVSKSSIYHGDQPQRADSGPFCDIQAGMASVDGRPLRVLGLRFNHLEDEHAVHRLEGTGRERDP